MPAKKAPITLRKQPKQARSARLVADILEAAVRVLAREGARRFTTVRVAEEAGVSVGSLYQYFPNKEALLFRLQTDEWQDTGSILDELLADTSRAPPDRLRRVVKTFFRSEREEAELRRALGDASELFRDVPETVAHRRAVRGTMRAFVEEALPRARPADRAFVADVLMTTLSALGKRVTEEGRTRAEVDRFADAVGGMLVGLLADHAVSPSPSTAPERAPDAGSAQAKARPTEGK